MSARSVPPEEIVAQREAGWPDFHPEDFCHRCGNRNVKAWHVDNEDWAIAASTGEIPPSEIICPTCFTDLWEKAAGDYAIWEVRLDPCGTQRPGLPRGR